LAAKVRDIVESTANNADLDADAAINQRLTQHLVDNAVKLEAPARNASTPINKKDHATHEPSGFGHMVRQAVSIAGILGLMVVLSLMTRLDRKQNFL